MAETYIIVTTMKLLQKPAKKKHELVLRTTPGNKRWRSDAANSRLNVFTYIMQ